MQTEPVNANHFVEPNLAAEQIRIVVGLQAMAMATTMSRNQRTKKVKLNKILCAAVDVCKSMVIA